MSIGSVLFLSLFMVVWCFYLGTWLVKVPQLLEMRVGLDSAAVRIHFRRR